MKFHSAIADDHKSGKQLFNQPGIINQNPTRVNEITEISQIMNTAYEKLTEISQIMNTTYEKLTEISQIMNTAYEKLTEVLPALPEKRKPTKLETLQLAIQYLRHLTMVLEHNGY